MVEWRQQEEGQGWDVYSKTNNCDETTLWSDTKKPTQLL